MSVFEHINRLINPRMSVNAVDAKYAASERQRVLVDNSRDAGITKILVPASITAFLLLLININYSIIDIIAISIFYFASVLLFLQNYTTVELTPDSIIIHRPVLRHVEIQKKSIEKMEITKNSAPLIVKFITAYSLPLTTVFFAVIFYHYLVRSHNPTILKFVMKNREVTFYTNNPEELMNKLGVIQ